MPGGTLASSPPPGAADVVVTATAGDVAAPGERAPRAPSAPWALLGLGGAVLLAVGIVGMERVLSALAVLLELVFLVYFVRHLGFAISAAQSAPSDAGLPDIPGGRQPTVSVLVACKDEEAVLTRLLASLVAIDYPEERIELIVVDDGSTDATGAILQEWEQRCARLRALRRPPGAAGGKSGALNAGLGMARSEVIVVFDADHEPRPDVLRRLVRHFQDPRVAAVQGRCVIGNPEDSPLTRLVAIDYLAGYLVNEYGRQSLFELPAYGGANCAVRASALRAAGGWNERSVTEDTDLTLRLLLSGYKVRYDVTAVDREEGVVTLRRYWRQRYRWARGHQQAWRDYRWAVWGSRRLGIAEKIETTLFLLGFHVPVAAGLGLVVLLAWAIHLVRPAQPAGALILWTLLFLGPLVELGGGLLVERANRREALALVWFLPIFFVSVALCTKAWLEALAGREYSWAKTKRSGDARACPAPLLGQAGGTGA